MIRCFIAIRPPEEIIDALDEIQGDLRGANWTLPENLHLTLAFLGEQTRHTLDDLDLQLQRAATPGFSLTLSGVGHFGGRDPRLAYAAVTASEPLIRLQAKVAQAARAAEIALADRRYTPHITLARWGRREVAAERLQDWVEANGLFKAGPFPVTGFTLYQSELSRHGALYTPLAEYPLTAALGADLHHGLPS